MALVRILLHEVEGGVKDKARVHPRLSQVLRQNQSAELGRQTPRVDSSFAAQTAGEATVNETMGAQILSDRHRGFGAINSV